MMPRRSATPPAATPPPQRRRGRKPHPDPRKHYLRIRCNDEELVKFRIVAKLHDCVSINVISREIILDELNTLLSEWPRKKLIAVLRDYGLTEAQIHSLLASI